MGADGIELDVRETADGQIVCIHDPDVKEVTGVEGLVNEMTYKEISALDAGKGQRIPLLSEVLDFAKQKIDVNIELKVPGLESRLLRIVRERDMMRHVWFSSFFHETLTTLINLSRSARTGVLVNEANEDLPSYAAGLGAYSINPLYLTLTPEIVDEARKHNLRVFPWTVNGEEVMEGFLKMHVDGIITDYPDICRRVVDAFRAKHYRET